MIEFDVPFIFERLGGPIGVWEQIQKHWPDARLTYPTVQMWKQREAISAPWQAPVMYLMKEVAGIDPLTCMRDDRDGLGA